MSKPLPVLICQCGCGEVIPPRPFHRYKPSQYIQAHYLKIGTHSRIVASREAKRRARLQPPDGWIAPSGLCECGCGTKTKIERRCSRPDRGEYIDHPRRWVRGHQAKVMAAKNRVLREGERVSTRDGYVSVWMPNEPGATKGGWILEHRLIYQRTRGVVLSRSVVVHHINGDKADNSPGNLVATTRRNHSQEHLRAQALLGVFLDDQLLAAVRDFVRQKGRFPDDLAAFSASLSRI